MATYKEIRGTNIEVLSSDPSNPVEGQVWYNSTSSVVKGNAGTTAGAWATGGSLNTGRRSLAGAGVSSSSAIAFGGDIQGGSPSALCESYNGTNWTEVGDLNQARGQLAGDGTQTSALAFGGWAPPNSAKTDSWNGSAWTEVNDMNTARNWLGGAGADNTSCLAFAGNVSPGYNPKDLTESWNGTNWTEVGDLNQARYGVQGFGIKGSAICAGGLNDSSKYTNTESWNETSWTEVNDISFERAYGGTAGADNTSGLIFGGYDYSPTDARSNKVELWNGTNWAEQADLSNPAGAFIAMAGAGTATSAITFGGEGPSNQMKTATQEWTGAGAPVIRTFTDS